ncbi:hypothetical protein NEOC65_000034 [Neochlamydia sp. AcF65]|uniref:tetratricopeptide repeat protein n=1 Tax=Neochlamydia sp. AcF65 TaxID=2795735 RepID=UPI001BCA2230|nr:tetratricopeptide repeat protein [Neochlamydia sp. AcF65]MBS4164988.1 hypothetical protein [Neochlamydia sp. AcF65]
MNLESAFVNSYVFTEFKEIEKRKQAYLKLGSYAEISLEIFEKLGCQDLYQASLVCKEWKLLVKQTSLWKKCHSGSVRVDSQEEKQLDNNKKNSLGLSSCPWTQSCIARLLWQDSTTVISDSLVEKVNAVSPYLKKEEFELKGVPSDGDCFFSAFLGSYACLSRRIPLLDDQKDKISYLRQVLAGTVKHTDIKRAEEIIGKGAWVSGLGEGELLASALSIPIRLVTVNEEQLICGIHDRLIFSQAGLAEGDRSQEWETIPQKERPQEYIFIVDLGGHFIYAQKGDGTAKKEIFDPSSPLATLPLKIFQKIFLSFSGLQQDELRQILDVRSCAQKFRQHMPSNTKLLTKYQPQKMPLYLDKLTDWLGETISPINQGRDVLANARLENAEEAYTQALKIAVREKDLLQESFCIEKLGDIYLRKETPEALLQAAGLYNYALHLASEERQEIIRDRVFYVQNLLARECKGKSLDSAVMKKQFESNRHTLKKFRAEIEKKVQALPESPSSQEVRELYGKIAYQIKIFFGQLTIQALHQLDPAPCEYAMIGFGSLAREEMTPYSDLEFGILMKEDNKYNRKYFKHLTTLIHLKVINLGETILPALNIPCLNDISFFDGITPRGFAFDGEGAEGKGCKTPFGNRQTFELIQTPQKMAQYIAQDENGKWWHQKEPHLPMELLTFTHLLGNHELTKQYIENIQEKLNTPYQENLNLRQYLAKVHLVKEDMISFDPGMGHLERQGMLFKVKNDLYRFPHLAVDRLSLLKKIVASNTFSRIEQLKEQGILTEGASTKLDEWISIALFMRLKTYSHYQAQKEMMNPLLKPFGFDEPELIQEQFALNEGALEKVKKIYSFFIPFYQAIQAFLSGDESILTSSTLDDNSPQAQGSIALRLFQHEEAIRWYLLATKNDPKSSNLLNALGMAYREQKNLKQAKNYIAEAFEIDYEQFVETSLNMARDFNNLCLIYLERGKLKKAIDRAEKAIKISGKLSYKDLEVATSYNNLGLIYIKQNDLGPESILTSSTLDDDSPQIQGSIALRLFQHEEAIRGYLLATENDPENSNLLNALGMACYEQKNLKQAKNYIAKALKIDHRQYVETFLNMARDFNNLCLIYQERGKLKKAIDCAEKAIKIYEELSHKDLKVATSYNNLGLIYIEQNDSEKALYYFDRAHKIITDRYGKNHVKAAASYSNLGYVFQKAGSLEKAIEYTRKALKINVQHFGKHHANVSINYLNLATIYCDYGNLRMAVQYINKAFAIDLKLFGENHARMAGVYHVLGLIYADYEEVEEAIKWTEKALDIDFKQFGEYHPAVASRFNILGCLYQQLYVWDKEKQKEKPLEYINHALKINRKLFGENHSSAAACYNNLGNLYNQLGNKEEAIKCINRAIEIYCKISGENSSLVKKSYENLSQVHRFSLRNLEEAAGGSNKARAIGTELFNHAELTEKYVNRYQIHLNHGNFKEAAECLKKALAIDPKLFGGDHSKRATYYTQLSQINSNQGNFDKATEQARKALTINLRLLGEVRRNVAKDYEKLSQTYLGQGNLEPAAECAKKAYAITLELVGKNYLHEAEDYNELSQTYLNQGDLKRAAEYVKKALAINLNFLDENYLDVAILYNKLSQTYLTQGDLKRAAKYVKKALAINLDFLEQNHPDIAKLYDNLSQAYLKQRKWQKAAEHATKALIVERKLNGNNSSEVTSYRKSLELICQEHNELKKAAKRVKESLTIKLKCFNGKHFEVAKDYHELGNLYRELGKPNKATRYVEKALAINPSILDENHRSVATDCRLQGMIYQSYGKLVQAAEGTEKTLAMHLKFLDEIYRNLERDYNSLGIIYQQQGNLNLEAEYVEKALAMRRKISGVHPTTVAIYHTRLSQIYLNQENLEKSAEYAEKALTLEVKLLGEYPDVVGICYSNLRQFYKEQRNTDMAAKYAKKALAINLKVFGENHPQVATDYNNLGQIYHEQGNLEKAAKYYKITLSIDPTVLNEKHRIVAIDYIKRGTIYYNQGNLNQAAKCFKKALAIDLKFFGENHPALAACYNTLGLIYQKQGNLKNAAECIDKALAIGVNFFDENRPAVANCYNNLGLIYQAQGNPKKAAECTDKARAINLKLSSESSSTEAIEDCNLNTSNENTEI